MSLGPPCSTVSTRSSCFCQSASCLQVVPLRLCESRGPGESWDGSSSHPPPPGHCQETQEQEQEGHPRKGRTHSGVNSVDKAAASGVFDS